MLAESEGKNFTAQAAREMGDEEKARVYEARLGVVGGKGNRLSELAK